MDDNPYKLCVCGDHAFRPINRGCVILVSVCDANLLNRSWYATEERSGRHRVRRSEHFTKRDGRRSARTIYLHQIIFDAGGELHDHINRNALDNRRTNLRAASFLQNARNASPRVATSRFKGVGKRKFGWMARITVDRKLIDLGQYDSEDAAAKAYDEAAMRYFGYFAVLNFPSTGSNQIPRPSSSQSPTNRVAACRREDDGRGCLRA